MVRKSVPCGSDCTSRVSVCQMTEWFGIRILASGHDIKIVVQCMFQTDMGICHGEVCSTAYLESSLPASSTDMHHVCTILHYYVCLEVSSFPSLSFLLSCRLLTLPIPSHLGLEGGSRVCGTRRSNNTGVLYSVQSNPYLVHTSSIVSTAKKAEEWTTCGLIRVPDRPRCDQPCTARYRPASHGVFQPIAVCLEMYVRSHRFPVLFRLIIIIFVFVLSRGGIAYSVLVRCTTP